MSDSTDRKEELLEAARLAVTSDRQLNYGVPEQNFERIATLWNAWFRVRVWGPGNLKLEPWEVATLCILMKLARLANQPKHKDSWTDIAGYAACGYDITEAMRDKGS